MTTATKASKHAQAAPTSLWGEADTIELGGDLQVHRITCLRCHIRYPETHYHCCVCHRVFRGASNFERHQKAFACYTDAALRKRGMVCMDGIWHGKPMDDEAKKQLRQTA